MSVRAASNFALVVAGEWVDEPVCGDAMLVRLVTEREREKTRFGNSDRQKERGTSYAVWIRSESPRAGVTCLRCCGGEVEGDESPYRRVGRLAAKVDDGQVRGSEVRGRFISWEAPICTLHVESYAVVEDRGIALALRDDGIVARQAVAGRGAYLGRH
jgi:hypothetical protein